MNLFVLLCMLSMHVSAQAGNLFNVTASGTPASTSINITLCLNATAQLSCQTYTVSSLDLNITTTVNHFYPTAGIKINTPGYTASSCTPISNGFCTFGVSNTASQNIPINNASTIIYDSLDLAAIPGSITSIGAAAYANNEFGNAIVFAEGSRNLKKVIVEMSSWGRGVSGFFYSGDCVTTPGSTFQEYVTLNIYEKSPDGINPGNLITTKTQNFSMPYRPSASVQCTGANAGKWYEPISGKCNNGMLFLIEFDFSGVVLPGEVVYGISYNTTNYGPNPYGTSTPCNLAGNPGCPYDTLNIAITEDPINLSIGSNSHRGTIWQNTNMNSNYCDNGAAGVSIYRLDSPSVACWSVNYPGPNPPYFIPAIRFISG